jgi:hypothetical protein
MGKGHSGKKTQTRLVTTSKHSIPQGNAKLLLMQLSLEVHKPQWLEIWKLVITHCNNPISALHDLL